MQLSGLYLKIRILVKSCSPDDAVKSGEPSYTAEISLWIVFFHPTNVSLPLPRPVRDVRATGQRGSSRSVLERSKTACEREQV